MFSKISAFILMSVMTLSMIGCQSTDALVPDPLETETAVTHTYSSDISKINALDSLFVSEFVFAENDTAMVSVKDIDSSDTLLAKLETMEAFDAYVDGECDSRAQITMWAQTYYGSYHEAAIANFEELNKEIKFGDGFSFNFGTMYGIEKLFDESVGQEVYQIELKTVLEDGMITEFTFPNGVVLAESSDTNGYMIEGTTIVIFDPHSVSVVVGY